MDGVRCEVWGGSFEELAVRFEVREVSVVKCEE